MKKLLIIIPVIMVTITAISLSFYYQIESTKPVCFEGSFPNGTCKGATEIHLQPNNVLIPAASWNDYDEFAQIIVSAADDKITEKRVDDISSALYTTKMGNLIIRKENTDDYSVMIDYSSYGTNMDKAKADIFVESFMKNIGYKIDGTEKIDRTEYGSHYEVVMQQRNHSWIIQNHMLRFTFWEDEPAIYVRLGKWYDNTSEIELKISQNQAKEIATAYIESRLEREPEFANQNQPLQASWVQMEIIDDSLVYVVSGEGFAVNVIIDPTSGNVIGWKEPQRID